MVNEATSFVMTVSYLCSQNVNKLCLGQIHRWFFLPLTPLCIMLWSLCAGNKQRAATIIAQPGILDKSKQTDRYRNHIDRPRKGTGYNATAKLVTSHHHNHVAPLASKMFPVLISLHHVTSTHDAWPPAPAPRERRTSPSCLRR